MFCFKIQDEEFKVVFQHERDIIEVKDKETGELKKCAIPYETICEILPLAEDGDVKGSGIATVGEKDKFNYSVGRKISLERALIAAEIARSDRFDIWKKYFSMTSENYMDEQ